MARKRKYDLVYARKKRALTPGYKTEEYRIYREKYPEKVKAQQIFNYALKSGKTERSPCEICGEIKVHAHHDNYQKPFDIRWLCPIHHKAAHAN